VKIKKIITTVSILFFIIATVAIGNQQTASAKTLSSNQSFNFSINMIGDAQRKYYSDSQPPFYLTQQNMQSIIYSGNTYTVNTKEVAIQLKRSNNIALNTYAYVDDKSIGLVQPNNVNATLLDYKTSGNFEYPTYSIKYLTPGKHRIVLKTSPAFQLGDPVEIDDYLYVNVPVVTDTNIDNSITNIKSGNGSYADYEIVGVNVNNLSTSQLSTLNSKIKDLDIDPSNAQQKINDTIKTL
jgi:hypothetical protein